MTTPGTQVNAVTVPGGDTIFDEDFSTSTTIAVASNGQALPQGTIFVASTAGANLPSAGTIFVTTSNGVQSVNYTGITGGGAPSFTGCTGGTGTMSTGGAVVSQLKMPASKIYVGGLGTNGGPVSSSNPLPVGGATAAPVIGQSTAIVTANVAVEVSASPTNLKAGAMIEAADSNGAPVFVGYTGVTISTGFYVAPGGQMPWPGVDLSTLYFVGVNPGDFVSFVGN